MKRKEKALFTADTDREFLLEISENFRKKAQEVVIKNGLTLSDIYNAIGLKKQTYGDWDSGKNKTMHYSTLFKLSIYLNKKYGANLSVDEVIKELIFKV